MPMADLIRFAFISTNERHKQLDSSTISGYFINPLLSDELNQSPEYLEPALYNGKRSSHFQGGTE